MMLFSAPKYHGMKPELSRTPSYNPGDADAAYLLRKNRLTPDQNLHLPPELACRLRRLPRESGNSLQHIR
ncbi:hypothetical protein D3C73_1602630 [compost metagenome]